MRRRSRILANISLFVVIISHTLLGQAISPKEDLVITAANIDFTNHRICITGINFIWGHSEPIVLLQQLPLAVLSASDKQIVAQLPSTFDSGTVNGLPSGTYLLTVTSGVGSGQFDTFDLTIGAVGPVGPPGGQGAT